MLAKQGVPFDSPEHLFEIKWDGTRVLAFVDSNGYRLVNRHRVDVTDRFPELRFLDNLPAGIVLDGEVVVLRQGKPHFGLLLSRNHAALHSRFSPWLGHSRPLMSSSTCFTSGSSLC